MSHCEDPYIPLKCMVIYILLKHLLGLHHWCITVSSLCKQHGLNSLIHHLSLSRLFLLLTIVITLYFSLLFNSSSSFPIFKFFSFPVLLLSLLYIYLLPFLSFLINIFFIHAFIFLIFVSFLSSFTTMNYVNFTRIFSNVREIICQ